MEAMVDTKAGIRIVAAWRMGSAGSRVAVLRMPARMPPSWLKSLE
jgi:hypothetical protein